jgi:hypothetical protein
MRVRESRERAYILYKRIFRCSCRANCRLNFVENELNAISRLQAESVANFQWYGDLPLLLIVLDRRIAFTSILYS